ncbi:hypothetical protein PVAND_003170 [Polypedilum vanderplanki]|uniref:Uncharacterized protein n=1 Tax=Polypedilum vanderplanki TaxID=319348 RepID=A0A9J6BTQ6_POLVA|nr:hypothetical protein PVAND_003170 [Polypedilum vanderplanki]
MGKNIKLTANDTKNTLSSVKKTKAPKTVLVKNVTDYWPVLSEENILKVFKILNLYLSDESNKKNFTIGLESTLRHLKSSLSLNSTLLAIADEISPKWFGKHLISMAFAKNPNIKIIILPKMKDHTKKLLNVPAIVWSLKNSDVLNEFYRNLNIQNELLKHYHTIKPAMNVSIKKKKKIVKSTTSEIIHLKKLSSSPTFIPNKEKEEESTIMEFEDNSDFISLSKFDDPSLVNKSSPMPAYRPLKVNKIIGNLLRKGK